MDIFNPVTDIENSELILEQDQWPNFHDAEVEYLNIWRGDIRPEDDIWIGPVIEMTLLLCALQNPIRVTLKFHDCDKISLQQFNHQNAIYDLQMTLQDRGTLNNGEPMTPSIAVSFMQAFGAALSFDCFRIEVISGTLIN